MYLCSPYLLTVLPTPPSPAEQESWLLERGECVEDWQWDSEEKSVLFLL